MTSSTSVAGQGVTAPRKRSIRPATAGAGVKVANSAGNESRSATIAGTFTCRPAGTSWTFVISALWIDRSPSAACAPVAGCRMVVPNSEPSNKVVDSICRWRIVTSPVTYWFEGVDARCKTQSQSKRTHAALGDH